MSDTSLWRALHSIKSSQRKALAGLDDVTAAGMNGFQVLINVANKWKCPDIIKSFEKGKRYLKSDYLVRCRESSTVKSRSTLFALSDTTSTDLSKYPQTVDNKVCTECIDLISSLNKLKQIVKESNDEDLLYDINVAIGDIEVYMKHQFRDAQQKLAKTKAVELLDKKNGFCLKDFCQKILPAKFQEGQKEYFEKKGMTLHVDVIFTKENNQLKKDSLFHSSLEM